MTLNCVPARLFSRLGMNTVDDVGKAPPTMVSRVKTFSMRLTGDVCQTMPVSTAVPS
jgi:hypothetical protein